MCSLLTTTHYYKLSFSVFYVQHEMRFERINRAKTNRNAAKCFVVVVI